MDRDRTRLTGTTVATGAAPSGSDPPRRGPFRGLQAAGFRRLFASGPATCGKNPPTCWTLGGRFAKRPASEGFPGQGSGRIAQLVEQLTLNQRVPGSSPGAPTKQNKDLTQKRQT